MKKIFLIVIFLTIQLYAQEYKYTQDELEKVCSGFDRWSQIMAFSELERINKITYDTWDKENSNVEILVSKRINEQDLPKEIQDLKKSGFSDDYYRQVYKITFVRKDGKKFKLITDNIINSDECSITNPDIYLLVEENIQ